MQKLAKGLWPVMLTPFNDSNRLDLDTLRRLTEFYIASGADGLFANCLSSEMFQLTDGERLRITRTVVETVNGRLPVIATGSFSNDIGVSANFIKKIYDTGIKAVVISTNQPCNEQGKDNVFKSNMEMLMTKTGSIPLGLYECPVPYKRLMVPETLGWLADSGRFLYHKDTSCDLDDIKTKIDVTKNTVLGVYNAHVPTGIESLKYGARGLSPIGANLYPELFSGLLARLNDKGKQKEVEKLNDALNMMDTIIHRNYPYAAKLFLQKRGFDIETNCRTHRTRMKPQDLNKLNTVMNVFHQLSEELGIEIVRF
ncbi:dihydrodipicolinate synthase family protein [Pricia sp.]|uniref:dihydrodipicolinate synthase family protein n=1 Tax=Pricia sp. TaxID=2268138 RepID=UPI0035948049